MINLKKKIVGSYNHKNIASDMDACAIDIESFTTKNEEMDAFMQKMDADQNLVAQLAECVENKFTVRELAFMVSKITLVTMIAQARAEQESKSEEE